MLGTTKRLEIAPGIFYVVEGQKCSLVLATPELGDIICWDYEEISRDPNSWYASLKAVALATQHGPSIARQWIKSKKTSLDTPAGTMFCNICNAKFVPGDDHPYVFSDCLNGKKFFDLQCSSSCNQKRRHEVYTQEIGESFLKSWATNFTKKADSLQP